jgi:hypothetical protein
MRSWMRRWRWKSLKEKLSTISNQSFLRLWLRCERMVTSSGDSSDPPDCSFTRTVMRQSSRNSFQRFSLTFVRTLTSNISTESTLFLSLAPLSFLLHSLHSSFPPLLPPLFLSCSLRSVFDGIDMDKVGVSESGASGAIFFFSKDNQFIAKSCTQEELQHLLSVASKLRDYFQENPHTLITQVTHSFALLFPSPHLCDLYLSLSFFCLCLCLSVGLWLDLRSLSPTDVCRTDLFLCLSQCPLDSSSRPSSSSESGYL